MPCTRTIALCILLAGLLMPAREGHAVTIYMAPGGNDAWSGSLERPNAEATDGPLASLRGARDAVRRVKADGPLAGPIRVVIADGAYPVTEPVRFSAEDSGTENAPIFYEAAVGARPVFSGGRAITGFEPGEDGVWQAHVPEVAAGEWHFEQLWVNGKRAVRARTPNEFYHYTTYPVPYGIDPLTGAPATLTHRAFMARAEDLRPVMAVPQERLSDVVVVAYHAWEASRLRIAAADPDTNTLYFTGASRQPFMRWRPRQRYHIENLREALDTPGEWYLDRDGTLHYMPLPGEDMATAEVIAPAGPEQFIEFVGEPDLGLTVEHITLRGLSLRHGNYILPPEGHSDRQASDRVPALIMADGARNVTIEDCEIAHIGVYAVWFRRGCRGSVVQRCHMHDLGAGGVRIGEVVVRDAEADRTGHITVDNNIIHGGGRIHMQAVGVWIGHSGDNRVTHNSISDLFYSGVSAGWTWGYRDTISKRNTIDFNHIHNIGWGVLSDMGGVYTLGDSEGTTVSNNVIHDVWSYDLYGRGGWGLYTDEGTAHITMENNLVYDVKTGCFHQHYGKENLIRNNIFCNSLEGQIQRSRVEDHTTIIVERNVFYWTEGPLYHRPRMGEEDMISRHNLYWKTTGEPVLFYEHTLEQWQAMGREEGSIVADPLFVDPENNDFRLRPDSPAFGLGFVEFDFSRAGVYGDERWVALAASLEYPPVRFAPDPPPPPPVTISQDFEAAPVGAPPAFATVRTEGKGDSIAVTDEHAAVGTKSLKIQDAPGLEHVYNPHFFFEPNHSAGVTRGAFYMRIEAGTLMYHEWRSRDVTPYRVGPGFAVADGKLTVGERVLVDLPVGEWFHVEITAPVGEDADGTWNLTVTLPGEASRAFEGLQVVHPDFRNLTWVGWSSQATEARVFYLDEIELTTTMEP